MAGGGVPRSVEISSRGIRTADDAANFTSAIIGDLMAGTVQPRVASGAASQMRNLLRIHEMKQRYGGSPGADAKPLKLAEGGAPPPAAEPTPTPAQLERALKKARLLQELQAIEEADKAAS